MNPKLLLPVLIAFAACRSTKSLQTASNEDRYLPVSTNVFISKYETTNLDYRSFLAYLKNKGNNEAYAKNLLDTSLWLNVKMEVMATYYHSHPGYNEYPVVTVSYEQANNYCQWLTEQYNNDPKRKFKKVLFRLPTEKEWITAASGNDENKIFPWRGNYMRNKNGNFLANFRRVDDSNIAMDSTSKKYIVMADEPPIAGSVSDKSAYFATVTSFFPNDAGFYNLAGNAAEMVAEKGITKGGSWSTPGYYLRNAVKQYYQKAGISIGFRVTMEIIEQ